MYGYIINIIYNMGIIYSIYIIGILDWMLCIQFNIIYVISIQYLCVYVPVCASKCQIHLHISTSRWINI